LDFVVKIKKNPLNVNPSPFFMGGVSNHVWFFQKKMLFLPFVTQNIFFEVHASKISGKLSKSKKNFSISELFYP
jgi:hypothetical protein